VLVFAAFLSAFRSSDSPFSFIFGRCGGQGFQVTAFSEPMDANVVSGADFECQIVQSTAYSPPLSDILSTLGKRSCQ